MKTINIKIRKNTERVKPTIKIFKTKLKKNKTEIIQAHLAYIHN